MKKPVDPYPPTLPLAAHSHFNASSSSPSTAFSSFMHRLINFSAVNHHNLATCFDLALVERISKQYWSCRSFMRSNGDLLLFKCKFVGFTLIAFSMKVTARIHSGGIQSFRCGHLWLQPSTTMVSDFQRKTDACTSFIFIKMRWL